MTDKEIKEEISECQKRKKEYIRLIKDIDLMRLAYARSIATETLFMKTTHPLLASKFQEQTCAPSPMKK